jgi:adenine-specific DNA-methyltransferase
VRLQNFKPIYYLGNKADFANSIRAALDSVDPQRGRVGEVFAGTGAVSVAVSSERSVLASDVQEYSRVLCSAQLAKPKVSEGLKNDVLKMVRGEFLDTLQASLEPLIQWEEESIGSGDPERMAQLLEAPPLVTGATSPTEGEFSRSAAESIRRMQNEGLWTAPDTTVSRLFGGTYFSYRQAAILDSALKVANAQGPGLRDFFVAVALSTASSLVNTVGKQFAQPLRPRNKSGELKSGFDRTVRKDRSIDALRTYEIWLNKYLTIGTANGTAIVLRGEFDEVLQSRGSQLSVVYADPPYTRDHYSRFYHVLETMCLRDDPEFSVVTKGGERQISRGLYRAERHQSEFCVRSQAPGAFERLFRRCREHDLPLVISYSPHESGDGTHPRVVSQEQIVSLARSIYKRVEVSVIDGSTHNVLNSTAHRLKDRGHAEILVSCFR